MNRPSAVATALILLVAASGRPGAAAPSAADDDPGALAAEARAAGDASRGAVVFGRPELACRGCHSVGGAGGELRLGPDLADPSEGAGEADLVASILRPSEAIREGYRPVVVASTDGRVLTGLVVEETPDRLVVRDGDGEAVALAASEIEERKDADASLMPAGLTAQLGTRQELLDLIAYVLEVAEGGPDRAHALEPDPALLAVPPLPAYESEIDHAGLIASLDADALGRGRAIYERVCANCHGTLDRAGSLPTSPRFAEAALKNGSDPHSMYQTLTRGFGRMAPQTWMVPRQKYAVIHYIREAYFRDHNPAQYVELSPSYLASLPAGDTYGPEPSRIEPWVAMDYGPVLINTYEVGDDGSNFAYKGIAVRLDPGPGGVSRGSRWMVFDHDTFRMAAAWTGEGFIDWAGIQFDGRHGVHPHLVGDVAAANPTGPGWADPDAGTFEDPRLVGRDGRHYGPLPRDWAAYEGLALHGQRAIIRYRVGGSRVRELPGLIEAEAAPVFTRAFQIGPRTEDLVLQVAHLPKEPGTLRDLGGAVLLGPAEEGAKTGGPAVASRFDGATAIAIDDADGLLAGDLAIAARIRTHRGGTIWSRAAPSGDWVPDAKALFVRGGRLVFDIGWVGAVTGRTPIADGRWHDVGLSFDADTGRVRLTVDGRPDGRGTLTPKGPADGHVVRLGYAAPNFPRPDPFFDGEIAAVAAFDRTVDAPRLDTADPAARWDLDGAEGDAVPDATGRGLDGAIGRGEPRGPSARYVVAGLATMPDGGEWLAEGADLRLRIPAGADELRFTLWFAGLDDPEPAASLAATVRPEETPDLDALGEGGPPRWSQVVTTAIEPGGADGGPFALDVLQRPAANPWSAQVRPSGLDFLPDEDAAVVCTWDGDVWRVDGLTAASGELRWRRIASGLFQPLGIKLIGGDIYVTCRDQIAILRDRNGDGEIDDYECFNNDQQVTDHFHEFALGLQVDGEGNLYYAKGARHALEAVVPQHGTLLRVSPDGSKTEIVATGFRAPNGVCVNPDGTFFVTDQEGHWIPKNRINHVVEGGYYGNFWGFTDVTDPSDAAMEPPVCWITNAMDRSPGEILRVESERWGPLNGSLLELSYGTGKVFVVPHEEVDGVMQGGVAALPIPAMPTGVMRGRFHPADGQLYACGLFAWAGDRTEPGGVYRIRATGAPAYVPIGLEALSDGLAITFAAPIDPASVRADRFGVDAWGLVRSSTYGSPHVDEHALEVAGARLADDRRTVLLGLPAIGPTRGMAIRYDLRAPDGTPVRGLLHNTIHRLGRASIADR